jgi:hypothetical protein
MMAALCLAAGALSASLAGTSFTLAWTHSIENVRWEEDWRLSAGGLDVYAARVRGSGAGMDVPAGAVLRAGVWHYTPNLPVQARLRLTHSPFAAGYELCAAGGCQPLADLLPGLDNTAVIEVFPCVP